METRKLGVQATQLTSFSPLAGIRYVETFSLDKEMQVKYGFSPLAGIRYVETLYADITPLVCRVSVPLRGLDMWKLFLKSFS